MPIEGRKVIVTTFAGRKQCMSLLLRYIRYLIKVGVVDHFHAWNFTRTTADEIWLRNEFEDSEWKLIGNFAGYYYHQLKNVTLANDACQLRVSANHNAHILLNDDRGDLLEIVLGGWDNTRTVFRSTRQGPAVAEIDWKLSGSDTIRMHLFDGALHIAFGKEDERRVALRACHGPIRVNLSSWNQSSCKWEYRPATKEKLMHVADKSSWLEYYRHYTQERYPNSIIVKCDDDITFIDPAGFKRFVQQVATNMGDHLLAFPGIINNGVCAFHLQSAGLLPTNMFGEFGYDTFEGRLWGDGRLAQKLHEYFIHNRIDFLDEASDLPAIRVPIGHRISINFFAVRSEDLEHTFHVCGSDDEHCLTVELTQNVSRHHLIVQSSIVSHLGFYRQRQTGMDEERLVKMYSQLADSVIDGH